ncbi:glycerate 2-kinase [Klebsiella variicola]|uniref:glycerate 2-kinase n=1 Tax=Klebsiella variicola TaxID=244366 RepID=UPI000E2BE382|nr:glycerate 2-kinase [Klebsiella variicola]EIY5159012.1 glycerate 2-kinase [Klebsiella variicola]ELA2825163.1 glycerate 2-kinase [Klebsiella variicola]EMA4733042.1 glycerate 2-kinase [Klebsiella variicola]MCJ5285609.1 glycerate 2-kinase [Klebsiella variicola]MCJ5307291.1 glycerate 2-kinase [Klebsiella variicola]
MKIVIAPDSYKESLSAAEVAQAIEKGFREIFPDAQYVSMPVADGGEGTVEAMIAATQGTEHSTWVTGPLGEKVEACWGMSGDGVTAFIEMAAASGLGLVPPEKRNPLITTSRGTGELILQALEHGAKRIIIGIGGSATNDGGAGMMQALGARLCDAEGQEIGHGGGSLSRLSRIDLSAIDPRLLDRMIHVACDVTNPLVGERGASRIFGPQKGATEAMIVELDRNLAHFADVIKASLQVDVKPIPGAGAAGGMGAALMAFLNAELRSGIEIVTEALKLEEQIHDCSLVVTGEGRIDSQSIHGKVPVGIARVAKKYRKPVIGIAGSLTHDVGVVHHHGIDAVFSVLTTVSTLEEAFRGAFDNIYRASRNIAATLQVGMTTEG